MNQQSWLYSDSFLKRAFAIWGHYMVANLIIGAAVFVVAFIVAATLGLSLTTMQRTTTGEGAPSVNVEVVR
jgi:hypothetical protein